MLHCTSPFPRYSLSYLIEAGGVGCSHADQQNFLRCDLITFFSATKRRNVLYVAHSGTCFTGTLAGKFGVIKNMNCW